MGDLILSWAVLSIAVWMAAELLPGVKLKDRWSAVVVAAIFGVSNALLGWLLFVVIGIATVGLAWLLAFLTRFIVDAILLKLTDALTDRIEIDGFRWALGAALVMAVVGTAAEWLVGLVF